MQLAPHFPGHPKEEQATREDQAYNAHQKAYGQCADNPQTQRRTDTDQEHLAALRSRKACSKLADKHCVVACKNPINPPDLSKLRTDRRLIQLSPIMDATRPYFRSSPRHEQRKTNKS